MKRRLAVFTSLLVLLALVVMPAQAFADPIEVIEEEALEVQAEPEVVVEEEAFEDQVADEALFAATTKKYTMGEDVLLNINKGNFASYAMPDAPNQFFVAYSFTIPSDGFVTMTYSLTGSGPIEWLRTFVGHSDDLTGKPVGTLTASGGDTRRVGLSKGTHYVMLTGMGDLTKSTTSTVAFTMDFTPNKFWEHETDEVTPIKLGTTYFGSFVEEPWYGYDFDHDFYELKVTKPVRVKIGYGKDANYGQEEDILHSWNLFLITEEAYQARNSYEYGGLEAEALITNQSDYGVHWPYEISVELETGSFTLNTGTYYIVAEKRVDPSELFQEAPYHFTVLRGFPDVADKHWAKKVIDRAVSLGMLSGYDNGNFGPEDKVTRGQVAVILWNMAGKHGASGAAKNFSDVKPGAYYYQAVRWASSIGVVSGYKDSMFGPNDYVTREQLAVMLANYAKYVAKKTVEGSSADYASMSDAAKVSGFARSSVGWCFKNKIMSGSAGKVNPQGNATRAETAKMVVFLYDLL